jgi:hypothetical protein
MAVRQQQSKGGDAQNDYSRKVALVQRVLGDPSLFPDEFKSWITRWLFGNVNFEVTSGQLPTVETHHLVGNTGEIAFSGAWVNFGGSNEPARYWKDYTGIVRIGGIVKSGVIGTTIFTLPGGYRPQYAMIYPVASNGALGIVTVNPDGTVVANSGSNVYFSLSGISFRQFA